MNLICTLLYALANKRQSHPQPAHADRDDAVDIYEIERRLAELKRTRMVLYASGVGR